jgi:hypothetical protein
MACSGTAFLHSGAHFSRAVSLVCTEKTSLLSNWFHCAELPTFERLTSDCSPDICRLSVGSVIGTHLSVFYAKQTSSKF